MLPSNATVYEGFRASFTCSEREGPSPPNFCWLRNEIELQSSDTVAILNSGELLLTDVRLNDTGNYTCEVFGPSGNARDKSLLIVTRLQPIEFTSKPFILTSTPSVQVVFVGGVAQFVCLISGISSSEVSWLKDGSSVNDLYNVEVIVERGSHCR